MGHAGSRSRAAEGVGPGVRAGGGGTGPPPALASAPAPGLITQVSQGYDALVNAIIRPPRSRYTLDDLGGSRLFFRGRPFVRTDLELRNARGMRICCSHWEPAPPARLTKELPCVIYLHGNSSSRLGCLENLAVVLAEGATMFAFDFTGSGLSAGEWVTLGWYEKDDLAAVVDHLRGTGQCLLCGGTVASDSSWPCGSPLCCGPLQAPCLRSPSGADRWARRRRCCTRTATRPSRP